MKNSIILLLSTFAWTCAALQPVCVDLGEEFGPQTLKVTDDKVVWITQRGATEGYCQDAKRISKKERATRAFCKQFKPRGRGAYSTIYAPRAATDWLVEHHAEKGKCTGRRVGSDVRMAYTRIPPANAAIVVETDAHGNDISWKLEDLSNDEVVAYVQRGSYGNNKKYTRNLYLEDGEYELTIKDSVGDGLKNNGYYAVKVNDDEVLRGFGLFKKEVHLFKVGEAERTRGRPRGMGRRDVAWLKAHNERREEFHKDHRVSYVPLMWSQALKDKAEDFVDHALEDCGVEKLHIVHMGGLEEGENAFGDIGVQVRSPDEVLDHWVKKKEGMGYPDNDTLTQVEWRGSNYLGCATGYKTLRNGNICERHVCLYTPAGNCDMAAHNARKRRNWIKPTLEKYTKCGSRCPKDGCYVSDFDGQ